MINYLKMNGIEWVWNVSNEIEWDNDDEWNGNAIIFIMKCIGIVRIFMNEMK